MFNPRQCKSCVFLLAALATLLLAPATQAENWPIDLDVNLFSGEDSGKIRPQLTAEFDWTPLETDLETNRLGTGQFAVSLEGEGVVVWDSRLNTAPSYLQLDTAFYEKFEKAEKITIDPNDPTKRQSTTAYNFGSAELKLAGRIETDQSMDNINANVGVEAGYYHGWAEGFKALIPSVWTTYEYVTPTKADARDAVDVDDDSFPRLRVLASINYRFGESIDDLLGEWATGLGIRGDYRYVREYNQEAGWEALGFDAYDYWAAALTYNWNADEGHGGIGLNSVYIKYSDGRQLAHVEDDRRITVGVRLDF